MKKTVFLVLLSIVFIFALVGCQNGQIGGNGKPSSTPTEGVLYAVSSDGAYAEVVGYKGQSTKVYIADTYEGVPVQVIGEKAFYSLLNFCLYKNIIDCFNCAIEIVVAYTNNNVKLARTLVNHFNINLRICQR